MNLEKIREKRKLSLHLVTTKNDSKKDLIEKMQKRHEQMVRQSTKMRADYRFK